MFQIDNQSFGAFLTKLRKEKGLTQKELAQKLYISDKAVSKWERGLSMPDISLLLPLAEILGVTTTELLHCDRLDAGRELSVAQVETLVAKTISLSEAERRRTKSRPLKGAVFACCAAVASLELLLLQHLGYSLAALCDSVLLVELLMLLFGGWFLLFAPTALPSYYDENKISAYSSGVFRMNLPGVHFNNSNWPHIVRAGQVSTMLVLVAFPALYFVLASFLPAAWAHGSIAITLIAALGILLPLYIAGKRYE